MQLSREAAYELARVNLLIPWVERGVRVLVILALAFVTTHLARRLLNHVRGYAIRSIDKRGDPTIELEKRAATIVSVLTKVATFFVWLVAVVMALNELTFNIQPLLAGLGVAGLALGLGAQTLIKDWLGGFLLLIEDQVRIGDTVTINGISGVVEEINLRTTVIRSENGAVHVISNGQVTTLSNMTREYVYYIFEATLAHRSDVDRALAVLEQVGAEISAEPAYQEMVLAPIEIMGLDRIADRGVVIRARIKTIPTRSDVVGRELNRRVNMRLAGAGIDFPVGPRA
jgi:small conductance mechanosensitive channel